MVKTPSESRVALRFVTDTESAATTPEAVEAIHQAADGDPYEALRIMAEHLDDLDDHADGVRAARLDVVRRLRGDGANMAEVAEAAGVTPSYLSRLVLADGARRRTSRRRGARGGR